MARTRCGFNDAPGVPGSGASLLVTNGPTLYVNIGFDPNFDMMTPKPSAPPIPGISNMPALVDTGALECCIDNLLAAQLNLPIVDRRQIAGVGGLHTVNVYLAQVHIPSLAFTVSGLFAGVDLKAGGQTHNALIGRTFLASFTMTYEGRSGTVTITND